MYYNRKLYWMTHTRTEKFSERLRETEGGVLGPKLLITLINDVDKEIQSEINL